MIKIHPLYAASLPYNIRSVVAMVSPRVVCSTKAVSSFRSQPQLMLCLSPCPPSPFPGQHTHAVSMVSCASYGELNLRIISPQPSRKPLPSLPFHSLTHPLPPHPSRTLNLTLYRHLSLSFRHIASSLIPSSLSPHPALCHHLDVVLPDSSSSSPFSSLVHPAVCHHTFPPFRSSPPRRHNPRVLPQVSSATLTWTSRWIATKGRRAILPWWR